MTLNPYFMQEKDLNENALFKLIRDHRYTNVRGVADTDSLRQSLDRLLLSPENPSVLFAFDFKNQCVLFIHAALKRLIGLTPEQLYTRGLQEVWSMVNTGDVELMMGKVKELFLSQFAKMNPVERRIHSFSLSLPLINTNKERLHVLCQFSVAMTDDAGEPMLLVGNISDVSILGVEDALRFAVSKAADPFGTNMRRELLYTSYDACPFTKRELELVKLIAEGLGNKQIADKLNISLFTAKAHRRNILKKVQCDNFSQVVFKARNQSWI